MGSCGGLSGVAVGGRAGTCLAPGERCVSGSYQLVVPLAQAPHPGVGAIASPLRTLLGGPEMPCASLACAQQEAATTAAAPALSLG